VSLARIANVADPAALEACVAELAMRQGSSATSRPCEEWRLPVHQR
jgi:hypothetical protein